MKVSSNGLNIIKKYESLKLKPYLCPAGKPTIGYGSTYYEDGKKVKLDDKPITKERAEELLLNITDKVNKQVTSTLRVVVNQNQFDALVSFVFNIGIGNFIDSTLLEKVNNLNFEGAAEELKRWKKSGGVVLNGLIKRRKEEQELFEKEEI